ncbi:hypothetical protein BU24DRAFT_462277 [Aaosphaeria arxii CBS 175.79]|uniref:Cora-domain-containing protein n=1 Tax=Aaosphaeria arxii CBS 175.79 TaxID=1450172 RepID=A0A6A5XTD0_9PLEO|nr:uncharacterized protein BU24DRAFT_462277 [Aaosphaeria arxii CBS 175.79]KAF2016077.1 hypothetical protein BU24DRAFT_462277 [Aaosphaeria arxii CBS 175.79]
MAQCTSINSVNRSKSWNTAFFTRQNYEFFNRDVQDLKDVNADAEDDLQLFIRDFESSVPSCQQRDIRAFCLENEVLPCAEHNVASTREWGQAWLDDREELTEFSRTYEERLSANELLYFMRQPRFGSPNLPNADRRLIYIADLKPSFVRALADTVPTNETKPLRDAIWKHLTLQTVIDVKIPPTSFPRWNLEFQMPYLALIRRPSSHKNHKALTINKKPIRNFISLNFLDLPQPDDGEIGSFGIYEAQISVLLCGADNYRYTGYAFVDTEFRDRDEESEDDEPEETGGTNDEVDIDTLLEDPIISDCEIENTVDANKPTWPPREYFLTIMGTRMQQVLRHWQDVVHIVEVGVHTSTNLEINRTLSDDSACNQLDRVGKEIMWVAKAFAVLEHLRSRLAITTEAWACFTSPNGNIHYFSDMTSQEIGTRIDSISACFKDLEMLIRKLDQLLRDCEAMSKSLDVRMKLETIRLNLQSNLLNLQSNELNQASHALNTQTIALNHDTNQVALETKKVAFESHKLAFQSLKVASESHEVARLGFSMNQFFLPTGIVAALFGTQQEIFYFKRTPMTFLVCAASMTFLMWVLAIGIFMVGRSEWFKHASLKVKQVFIHRQNTDEPSLQDMTDNERNV